MRLEAWKTQIGRVRHLNKLAAFRGQGTHASFVYLGKHVRESVLSAVIRQSISELRTTQTLDAELGPCCIGYGVVVAFKQQLSRFSRD